MTDDEGTEYMTSVSSVSLRFILRIVSLAFTQNPSCGRGSVVVMTALIHETKDPCKKMVAALLKHSAALLLCSNKMHPARTFVMGLSGLGTE